ncbi:response regulator [Mucilaginibacter terrenus]|nr:response regulator [Mucilaginibacter terrenus]
MISGAKRIPLMRYGLIVMLIVVLFGSAFYLYLHYNKAEQTRVMVQKLISSRENSALIDSSIIEIYNADNSSRMYALTGKKQYASQLAKQLRSVQTILDTIARRSNNAETIADVGKLSKLISQKSIKTENYIKLMGLTDSLLQQEHNTAPAKPVRVQVAPKLTRRVKTVVHIDTIKPAVVAQQPVKRKKFLARLFGGKDKQQQPVQAAAAPVVVKRTTDTTITVITPATTKVVTPVVKHNYARLYTASSKLRKNEKEILELNSELISQVVTSLRKYKIVEQKYLAGSKSALKSNVANVLYEFRRLAGMMFLLLTTLVVVILYNIWKIFRNEEDLVTYTEKAEVHAQAKSRFMANMSHEIRTPLNSIVGFAEQLSQSELTDAQHEQTRAIRSSSKMLLEVVNEILDFSKYETGKMSFEAEPFHPHEAIEDVITSLRVQAGKKGLALRKQIDFKQDVCVKGDVHRFKQVVMNLVGNSIKFTAKGSVTVRAFVTDSEKPGQCVLNVMVKDTGVGIDKEHMPYIFDEFSQVKSAQRVAHTPGTGLGLAICKKIIELQGGSIKVTSQVNRGSIFSFKLPMEVSTADACIQQHTHINLMEQHEMVAGKHVLIADDNKLNVLLVGTILKKWNITYDVAYDGREALQLFEDGAYDVVLTDIEMPEMGGIELCQMIRTNGSEEKSSVPILALTANVMKEDRDKYLAVGMNGVVLKPFTEQSLVDSIAAALNNVNMLLQD